MKKFFSLIMTVVLTFSFAACGGEASPTQAKIPNYEKLDIQTALHSSPEQNANDLFYKSTLTESPDRLISWNYSINSANLSELYNGFYTDYFFQSVSELSSGIYESLFSIFNAEDISDLWCSKDGSRVETYYTENYEDYNKDPRYKDRFYKNVQSELYLYENNLFPKSIMNRLNWEIDNQFYFTTDYSCYVGRVNNKPIEYADVTTKDFLAVGHGYGYYDDKILDKYSDFMYMDNNGHGSAFENPYFNFYKIEPSQTDFETSDEYLAAREVFRDNLEKTNPKATLTGPYSYDTAKANLENELNKMKDTVTKYLEQKYQGVDNGVEFSDYMLDYTTYEHVKAFMKAQAMNVSEIKDVNIYANPLSFHPFVDVEYTLVIDGTDYKLHEIYFLEIDQNASEEFIYKIAYVADYTDKGGKYRYYTFRAGHWDVNESYDKEEYWDWGGTYVDESGLAWYYFVPIFD